MPRTTPNRTCEENFLPLLLPAPGPRGLAPGNHPRRIGLSNRALHETVAFARLQTDRKRVLHEPHTAGILPAEAAGMESRVAPVIQRASEPSPGGEPFGTGYRRSGLA